MDLNKSDNPWYTQRFIKHIAHFVETYSLLPQSGQIWVGVSGGRDSIVLCVVLEMLRKFGYSCELNIIHIHHGTRQGQDAEAQFVQQFCKAIGAKFHLFKLDALSANDSNFENKARDARYEIFEKLTNEDTLVLGHHIDDSFEWSFLQSMRSSHLESSLGVPVKNKHIVRPLMCVTRAQITRFAAGMDIPFIDDPTNESIRHERNYLRHEVISSLTPRHPKYLKHYVYRQNQLARVLGKHLLAQSQDFKIYMGPKDVLIYSVKNRPHLHGIEDLILKGIHGISRSSRGTLQEQIKKIVQALRNDKFGPLTLSGNIKVYLASQMIMMTCQTEFHHHIDERRAQNWRNNELHMKRYNIHEYRQLCEEYLSDKDFWKGFPFLVVFEQMKGFHSSRQAHPLAKMTTAAINQQGLPYNTALGLLRQWHHPKNRQKVLKLAFISCD